MSKKINWVKVPLDKNNLVLLSKPSNTLAILQTISHVLIIFASLYLILLSYKHNFHLLTIMLLMVNGVLFSFLGWAGAGHELIHRTVFSKKSYNDMLCYIFAFFSWNNPIYFRKSHITHHKYTLKRGIDYEVVTPQKVKLRALMFSLFFDFEAFYRALRITIENSFGIVKGEFGRVYFNTRESKIKLVNWARILLLGQVTMMILFFSYDLWILIFAINLAPFFCTFINRCLALGQHIGMSADTKDFRENSRTIILNPVLKFLYWGMNYHVEHHMYPSVPFYNLKLLREKIKNQLPTPENGLISLLNIIKNNIS